MSFGTQKSTQSSTPVDMTPTAFKGLQAPFAQRLAQLLGFGVGGTTTGTGGGTTPLGGTATMAPKTGLGSTITLNPATLNRGWDEADDLRPGQRTSDQWTQTGTWQDAGGKTHYTYTNKMGKQISTDAPLGGTGGGTGGAGGPSVGPMSSDPLSGIPTYGGPLTAPLGTNEQNILNRLMSTVSSATGGTLGTRAERELMQIIAQNKDYGKGNPFTQAMIETAQRPTLQGLTETLTRDLPGRFTQAGQFVQPQGSSAFDRAAAIASRGAANALGDIATRISFESGEASQNRWLDAAKALPGVTATQVDTLVKNLQAQGLPRLIQQLGIDKGIQLFNKRVDDLMRTLAITAGVTQPTIAQQSQGKSSGFNFGLGS